MDRTGATTWAVRPPTNCATQLVQSGKYVVVERAQLDAILQEQNLGASGAVTPATAAKVGKLLGVQLLLTGSMTQFSIQRTSVAMRGIGGTYSTPRARSMRAWSTPRPAK